MTLKTATSMDGLYQKLALAGLDRKFVREVLLPEWWDNAIADTPAGMAETELRLARALGVELQQVREGEILNRQELSVAR